MSDVKYFFMAGIYHCFSLESRGGISPGACTIKLYGLLFYGKVEKQYHKMNFLLNRENSSTILWRNGYGENSYVNFSIKFQLSVKQKSVKFYSTGHRPS